MVRVYTASAERTAPDEILAAHDSQLQAHAAASQAQVGGLRMADLPTAEDGLQAPGDKDGATKVVNNKGRMEAHTVSRRLVDGGTGVPCRLHTCAVRVRCTMGTLVSRHLPRFHSAPDPQCTVVCRGRVVGLPGRGHRRCGAGLHVQDRAGRQDHDADVQQGREPVHRRAAVYPQARARAALPRRDCPVHHRQRTDADAWRGVPAGAQRPAPAAQPPSLPRAAVFCSAMVDSAVFPVLTLAAAVARATRPANRPTATPSRAVARTSPARG